MAGRILSDHFDSVTIVVRDQLAEDTEARRGIPQGQHIQEEEFHRDVLGLLAIAQ